MSQPKIAVGLYVPAQPPLGTVRQLVLAARLLRLDGVMVWDHFLEFFPTALWDREFSWIATQNPTPHQWFDFQTLLGYLAGRAGRLRLGVGATEAIRRHPVVIAQAMLTLAHLTRRPPVLVMGAGERMHAEPYGLDFSRPVDRLEEALRVIRLCFSSQGPVDFRGEHFRLEGAILDLQPPAGRTPELWVAAHGPRMLRLAGRYGDGWYPAEPFGPEEYAAKLAVIHAAMREAGRDPAAFTPSFQAPVIVAPTEREARAMVDAKPIRFLGLLYPAAAWRRYGQAHPFGEEYRGSADIVSERYDRAMIEAAIAAVPAEMLLNTGIWGTPEQVIAKLRAYGEAGCRHVTLLLGSTLVSRRAALYGLRAARRIARALASGS